MGRLGVDENQLTAAFPYKSSEKYGHEAVTIMTLLAMAQRAASKGTLSEKESAEIAFLGALQT